MPTLVLKSKKIFSILYIIFSFIVIGLPKVGPEAIVKQASTNKKGTLSNDRLHMFDQTL